MSATPQRATASTPDKAAPRPEPPLTSSRLGLAGKLVLLVGVLLVALSVGMSVLSLQVAKREARESLGREGDAIATTLNHTFEVLLEQGTNTPMQRVAANSALLPDVREVTVVDLGGNVLASSNRAALGKPSRSPYLMPLITRGDVLPETYEEEASLVIVRPLLGGKYKTNTDSGLVGAVEVVLDRRGMIDKAERKALGLLGVQLGGYALLSALLVLVLRQLVVGPLYRLATAARRHRAGERGVRTRIRTRDEIGIVSEAFDEMAREVQRTVATLEDRVKRRTAALAEEVDARTAALDELAEAHAETTRAHEELRRAHDETERALGDAMHANTALESAHADLHRAHEELVASMHERLRLAETVKALSTPVLRVHRGLIAMPLVGSIDAARAKQIETSLLAGIERHDARRVILDLSGVPIVDVEVARALVRARRCAELVGARVTLVGMSGQVAMSVVRAGLDLSGLVTLADLESGLVHALGRMGLEIRPAARRRARSKGKG
jgi:anti-anti-sigma regulatory factor/HAMP domain-containing protein